MNDSINSLLRKGENSRPLLQYMCSVSQKTRFVGHLKRCPFHKMIL